MIRLAHRKYWLVVGLIVITAWASFALGIRPAVERIETLNRVIPEKQKVLEKLRANGMQYLALQAGLDDLRRRAASEEENFELLTFLEAVTGELRLTKKVTVMKQEVLQLGSAHSEIIVETKLENLTLEQLIEFLLRIKSSNHLLWIKSLYTKKSTSNPNLLDTTIQISTLKPK
jgi:hypothetical protein